MMMRRANSSGEYTSDSMNGGGVGVGNNQHTPEKPESTSTLVPISPRGNKNISITSSPPLPSHGHAPNGTSPHHPPPHHQHQQQHKHDHSTFPKVSEDHNDHSSSSSSSSSSLEYGFVPRSVINLLKDKDWKVRSDGIEKFYALVTQLPNSPAPVLPHLSSLIKFLGRLLFDSNFTICLTTIRLIGELLPKLHSHIKPSLSFFVPNLVEKFGDSKIIIRQETMKVITKLMQIVSPSTVIELVDSCFEEKAPNIQQHLIIVVIKALLTFKDQHFDYPSIIPMLLSGLHSPKVKVKQASIEALALVNDHLGNDPTLLEQMLSGVDPDTIKMLQRRFARGQYPILGPDGSVEFRIGPDGSIADSFFDPSIATPSATPTPSRTHTPVASFSPLGGGPHSPSPDESMAPDMRPMRHWSAGAKVTTLTKFPPWFPINTTSAISTPNTSSPSTPSSTSSDELSTDIRRSIFQRTRSLSLSDKSYTSPADDAIFSLRSSPSILGGAGSSTPNLPPISASHTPNNARITSPTEFSSPFFSPVQAPNSDTEPFRKRSSSPLPTNNNNNANNAMSLRETGYTPSFGKKGASAIGIVHPSALYPLPSDMDTPINANPNNYNSYNNNDSAFLNYNTPNANSGFGTKANNNPTFDTNNNADYDSTQQHRAMIWSTLKPSTLATFPLSKNEPPKRRFSVTRVRREPTPILDESTYVNNSSVNNGILENVEDDFDFNVPPPAVSSTTPTSPTISNSNTITSTSSPSTTSSTTAHKPSPDHPKSAARKHQAQQPRASPPTVSPATHHTSNSTLPSDDLDEQVMHHVKSSPSPFSAPMATVDPPRASSGKTPVKPRTGHSRHISRDKDAESAPPATAPSGPRQVNTSPQEIIPSEQLNPLENPELEYKQVMEWFANGEWYHQFEALASVRRLAAFHSRLIIPQMHPLLIAVLNATNNLRSLVSRHALVCIGDLFKHVGKSVEPHLDEILLKVLKKYNESNNFLEKELDRAMGLMLLNVSEARAVGVLLMSVTHKSSAVRIKIAFFLANLVDLLGSRVWTMREADRVLGAAVTLIQESAGEARAQGRRTLFIMHQSDPDEFEKVLKRQCNDVQQRKCREVLEKIKSCGDPLSLGAKKSSPSTLKQASRTLKPSSAHSYTPPLELPDADEASAFSSKPTISSPLATHKEKEKEKVTSPKEKATPSSSRDTAPPSGRDTLRGGVKGISAAAASAPASPISNNVAPELDTILTDLESADWRTRHTAIGNLVELSNKDGKVQALLVARIIKIFDHFTPRLSDANSKVNMHALSSLKQMIPRFGNGMESVLGVLLPALIANLATSKADVRALTLDILDDLLIHVDPAALVPHIASGVANHPNPKVKVVLLHLLADLVGSVYASRASVVVKHVLPLAFKLLDEKKGELRSSNTKLLQSLFKVMGNALWENSNSFNLSKQEQTQLHEILIS